MLAVGTESLLDRSKSIKTEVLTLLEVHGNNSVEAPIPTTLRTEAPPSSSVSAGSRDTRGMGAGRSPCAPTSPTP